MLDFAHALGDYERAIALDPDLAAAYVGRGAVFTFKVAGNDPDRAIVDFGTALRIDPNNTRAYLGRARAYQRKCGACPEAVRDASEAVRLAAGDKDTLVDAHAAAFASVRPSRLRSFRRRRRFSGPACGACTPSPRTGVGKMHIR
ncbi:MAG TPA: hypothetical protein VII40_07815 [Xanthobacteraceae bacterium]